jgi:MFS family permease
MSKQERASRNLYVLILSMLPVTMTTATIYMVLPLYFKSVGFSTTDVGLLIALGTLPGAFSALFMGWLSDHIGRKRLLVINLFLYASCFLLFYFFLGFAAFAIIRFIEGFSIWAAVGLAPTIIADMIPPERRGQAMGLYDGVSGIGRVTGPLIAGMILTLGSYSYYFIFCATSVFISTLVVLILLKETLAKQAKTLQYEFVQRTISVDNSEKHKSKAGQGTNQRKKAIKTIALFYSAAFVRSVGQTAISPLMSLFFTNRLTDISSMELSILFSAPSLIVIVIAPLAGRLSDRIGRKKPLIAAIVIFAIVLYLYTQTYSFLQALMVRLFEGTATGFIQPLGNAYLGDLLVATGQTKRSGAGYGIFQFLTIQTSSYGTIFGGYIIDTAGYNTLFAISAIIVVTSLIPLSKVPDPHDPRKRFTLVAKPP